MALRRKTSAYHVERIRQLASAGWHAGQIAQKLGLARHTIYAYACNHGLDIPAAPNPRNGDRRRLHAEIVEYARENLDQPRTEMAARFGVSGQTIMRVLEKAGLPTKRIYDADGNVIDRAAVKV